MASHTLSPHALAQFNSPSHSDTSHVPSSYRTFKEDHDDGILSRLAAARAYLQSLEKDQNNANTNNLPKDEKPIPITSKALHKFYEPVILLVSLMDAVNPQPSTTSVSDASSTISETDIQIFKAFVNKLSHICSSSKGVETVTSFVVLRDRPEPNAKTARIHYWFAMNQQSREKLDDTQTYVESLLHKIGRAPSMRDDPAGWEVAKREIFRNVLVFNRPRITSYLRMIRDRVDECIRRIDTESTKENRLLALEIEGLVGSPTAGESLGSPESEYLETIQTTIRRLLHLERSNSYPDLLTRAEKGRLLPGSSQECFSDLVHTSKRILAYPQSVQYIMTKARPRWPELFSSGSVVSFLPSSKPIPKPRREKSLKAENMVGRMTRKEKEIRIFREFVRHLQAFDLDERIFEEYDKASFTPRVHSEVILLNWLWEKFGVINPGPPERRAIDPSVFFNGWMYIGSSKPTCRLCHYYFEERKSGVEHRDTHMNLYPAWAFPEVFPSQGEAAIADRQIMFDRVLQRVRKDAFEVVRKKVSPHHKAEDSNTFSEAVTLDERWTILSRSSIADVDEITSMMGEMSTEDYLDHDEDHDDEGDDDNGGALL